MVLESWQAARLLVTGGQSGPATTLGSVTLTGQVPGVRVGGEYAMRFLNGRAVVTPVPSLTGRDFTVEAWILPRRGSTERPVFARRNGATEVSITVLSDGTLQANLSSAAGGYRVTLRTGARVDDGQWHHVSLVVTRALFGDITAVLWVDGAQVRAGRMVPGLFGIRPDLSLHTEVLVGGDGGRYFLGDVLALAVYDSASSSVGIAGRAASAPEVIRRRIGWGMRLG